MLQLTGKSLTLDDVFAVACHHRPVAPYAAGVRAAMQASVAWVAEALHHPAAPPIYGVTTGFGPLARTRVAPHQAQQLSRNLILNCLAGVGDPLPLEVVRAMMLIRANLFANGLSGIRPEVAETLIHMLNAGVTPWVPRQGSLGASGDLAPLAHIAVVLTCDPDGGGYSGRAHYQGQWLDGAEAMRLAGLPRHVPHAKEGLALTNGTTLMAAVAALAVHEADNLLNHAMLAAALTFEAHCGLSEALAPELHAANRQPGQMRVAERLRALLAGSDLVDSLPDKVQDAYSLRCAPQVIGPALDLLDFVRGRVADTLNAVSDNPLIFVDDQGGHKISGGNFHGQGLSLWLDALRVALAGVANQSERRTFRLLTPELSDGLPAMLVRSSGLDSGLMIPQYTAAALVNDNKILCHPASVDSIPSSGNQEDHVSMGANAALHTLAVLDNVRSILAIELLTAAQAIDLRPDGPNRLGAGTRPAYVRLRQHVRFLEHDRETTPDIETLARLIARRDLLAA